MKPTWYREIDLIDNLSYLCTLCDVSWVDCFYHTQEPPSLPTHPQPTRPPVVAPAKLALKRDAQGRKIDKMRNQQEFKRNKVKSDSHWKAKGLREEQRLPPKRTHTYIL